MISPPHESSHGICRTINLVLFHLTLLKGFRDVISCKIPVFQELKTRINELSPSLVSNHHTLWISRMQKTSIEAIIWTEPHAEGPFSVSGSGAVKCEGSSVDQYSRFNVSIVQVFFKLSECFLSIELSVVVG